MDVSLVEIPCMQNREHTTPPMFAFRDQSRCVSCVVHSPFTSDHFSRFSHACHIAHNKTQDARQPGANTTRDARLTRSLPYITARALQRGISLYSTQSTQLSGQTREKQKAKRVKHSHRAAGGAAGSSSWRRRQETSDISRYRRESSIPCGVRVAAALVGAGSPR